MALSITLAETELGRNSTDVGRRREYEYMRAGTSRFDPRDQAEATLCVVEEEHGVAVAVDTLGDPARCTHGERTELPQATVRELHVVSVVWLPDQSLSDGAAQLETNGYFDADNQPPWDAWVAWVSAPAAKDLGLRNMLIAWVPDDLVELVRAGVDANPEECLQWLQDDGSLRVPGTTDRFALMESGAKCSWELGDDVRRSR
jgi:hypothetical protein